MAEVLLRGHDVHVSYGPAHILREAAFRIHPGDKIALVGPNGAGKTTLFKLLAGQQKPDIGDIETKPGLRVAYLPQIPDFPDDTPVRELLAAPTARGEELAAEAAALEAWMAEPDAWDQPDASERMQRYTDVQEELAKETANARVGGSPLFNELGVPDELIDSTWGALSGGERSKIMLVKTLTAAREADIVLLDEPTNHMDIQTVEFIEQYIMGLDAAIVVAAHDEYLLDNIATSVFEVDHKQVFRYQGNYTAYRGQREAYAQALAAKKRRDFNEVKRQLAIIEKLKSRNRFDAQVKSRKTRLSKREEDGRVAPTKRKGFRFFLDTEGLPQEILDVRGVSKSFGDRTLFKGATFEVEPGDKIGIIGPNGCGKSTLIKTITGRLAPDEGEVKIGKKVRIGYFAQHHETLQPERELIDEIRSLRDPPPPDEWTRGLLGRFQFSGDTVFKRVKDLSGGERARLALAKFIGESHNVLVLDEPTNHLDLESQQIVAGALQEYEGTLLVVSHDRAFLDRVCDRIGVIAHGRFGIFPGNFSEASTSKQLADFTKSGVQGRFVVRKAFRDWESDKRWQGGDEIVVTGMETQAFRRMLRAAVNNGWLEAAE